MLQRLAWSCLRKAAITISILIILVAVTLTTARMLSPLAGYSKTFVEHITANILKHPVHIQKFMLKWSGLEPLIIVQNVSIEGDADKRGVLNVHRLSIGIDLWHSLLHFQILPSHLMLDGARVNLKEQADKSWKILGVGNVDDAQSSNFGNVKDFFYWLATQSNVSISHVNAELTFYHGQKIELKALKIQMRNRRGQREIVGVGKIKANHKGQPFRFVIKPTVVDNGPGSFGADFYLNIPHLSLQPWVNQVLVSVLPNPMTVSLGDLSSKVWGTVALGHLTELTGKLRGSNIKIQDNHSKFDFKLKKLSTNFFLDKQANGWKLIFDQLKMASDKQPLKTHKLALQYKLVANHPYYQFNLDNISLNTLKDTAKLAGFWDQRIKELDHQLVPQGLLSKLDFSYQVGNNHFTLSSNFSKLNINAHQKYPGVNNLSGKLLLNQNQGEVLINSQHVKVNYPYLFSEPFKFCDLKTKLIWSWSEARGWLWQMPEINLNNDNLIFQGKLSLLQAPSASSQLNLQGKFSAKNAGDLSGYVPLRGISHKLHDWLRGAFHGGSVTGGEVRIKGPLGEEDHKPDLHVRMHVADLGFHYAPEWPSVKNFNGILEFNNNAMTVMSHDAYSVGNHIDHIQAKIPDLSHPVLSLSINTKVPMQTGINFLMQSPLDIGKVAKDWQGGGDIGFQLTFKKNLKEDNVHADVKGKVNFENNKVQMMSKLLKFTKLNGQIQFHNEVMTSNTLTANLFGDPFSTSITTVPDVTGPPILSFALSGKIGARKLDHALDLPILSYAKGSINYKGQLKVSDGTKGLSGSLSLDSDLSGLSLSLPFPYSKALSASHPFSLQMVFDSRKRFTLNMRYKNLLSYYADYQYGTDTAKLLSGELKLGAGDASSQTQPGLLVDGYLPQFNWDQWSKFMGPYLSRLQQKKANKNAALQLRKLEIEVRSVNLFNQAYGNTYLNILPHKRGWLINIENKKLYGNIVIPNHSVQPWQINFTKFNLALNKKYSNDLKSWRKSLDPREIPAINFSCQSCQFNHKDLGKVNLSLRKIKSGVAIDKFKIDSLNYTIQAKGSWTCVGAGKKCLTDLYGYFSSYDLGGFLKTWGIAKTVADGYGETTFSLDWKGAPYHIALEHLTGHISFNYSNGRIVKLSHKAESKIGLGRLLNLLSLQSLPQNLITGFTHLGTKGFEFTSLKGELTVKDGVGQTENVELAGPIAWVSINGAINFAKKQYDLTMNVVPNVTSSIPLIVGLAGGPVAGALTWVINKVLASKIGEVAAHEYHVQGSMSEPTITAAKHKYKHKHKHSHYHKKIGKPNEQTH